MSGPGALCVGARRCVGPARRFQKSSPGALSVGLLLASGRRCRGWRRGPVSPNTLFVRSRQSVCRAQALSVAISVRGPAVLFRRCLCRAPALFASGPGAPVWCRGPALLASGPAAPCAGARRSFCHRAPALCLSAPGALRRYLCVGTRRSVSACVSGPGAPRVVSESVSLFLSGFGGLHIRRWFRMGDADPPATGQLPPHPALRAPSSGTAPDPRTTQPAPRPIAEIRVAPIRRRGPPAPIRVPPIQPGAFPFSRREPQTLLFGGNNTSLIHFAIPYHTIPYHTIS